MTDSTEQAGSLPQSGFGCSGAYREGVGHRAVSGWRRRTSSHRFIVAGRQNTDEDLFAVLQFVNKTLVELDLVWVKFSVRRRSRPQSKSHDARKRPPRQRAVLVDVCDDESGGGKNNLRVVVEVELQSKAR